MLECYLEHRREVVSRRTQFRLRKAEERLHVLDPSIFGICAFIGKEETLRRIDAALSTLGDGRG